MNNIFKNTEMIKLDDNYYLTTDGFKGICLVFHEKRTIKKKETEEEFEYEEKYYYANVGQALEKYITLQQMSSICTELGEVVESNNKILNILEDFKNKFKNW